MKLVFTKGRHVKPCTWCSKSSEMIICTECLQLLCSFIFHYTDTFVSWDAVVKRCCWCFDLDRSVGDNLRLLPATCQWPVNAQHMVSEETTELELFILCGLNFAEINWMNLEVISAEGGLIFGCVRCWHWCISGLHEHRWLNHLWLKSLEISSKFCRSFEHGRKLSVLISVVELFCFLVLIK